MNTSSNKLVLGIVPFFGILLLYFGIPYINHFPAQVVDNITYIPYLVLTGAIFMGIFFKRHRATLIAFTISIAYIVIQNIIITPELPSQDLVIICLLNILVPLNIVAITRNRDQQILSVQSFVASGAILLQLIGGYWLIQNYLPFLVEWLLYKPESFALLLPVSVPLTVLAAYLISFILMFAQLFKKGSVFEVAYFGALLASVFAMQANLGDPNAAIYSLFAGLLVIWGLLHNSYLIAYIDELTELPGRRAMNEEMARLRGKYSIAMLDIDHFKPFNDTYGHDVGDQVLRMVASKIGKVNGGGKPFRYGGEEFCVIFSGKDSKASFPFLSNIRESIDAARLILRNQDRPANKPDKIPPRKIPWQEVHVTISIGVAHRSDELPTAQDVLKASDEALYRSKEKGRNCISQHSTKDYDPELDGTAVE